MATVIVSRDYPLVFDSTTMYYPSSYEITEDVVEKVNQTEAGTDQIQLVRTGKVSIACQTKCLADWLVTYKTFSTKTSFTVKYYDPSLSGYAQKTMRMRGFKWKVVKHSYDLEGVAGIYEVSFTLKEF